MNDNRTTFWDKRDFLIKFANMPKGKDKDQLRKSEEYQTAMEKAYTIFPFSQRNVIYKELNGKLEKELKRR